jgi:hypothetical protein
VARFDWGHTLEFSIAIEGIAEFRVSARASRCGGFRAKAVVIGILRALESQRRMLATNELAEGDELETNTLRAFARF